MCNQKVIRSNRVRVKSTVFSRLCVRVLFADELGLNNSSKSTTTLFLPPTVSRGHRVVLCLPDVCHQSLHTVRILRNVNINTVHSPPSSMSNADVHRPDVPHLYILPLPSHILFWLLFSSPSQCRGITRISEDSSEIAFLLIANYTLDRS